MWTHVNHLLVVQTLNAEKSITKLSALVYQLILEVHQVVVQNVSSAQNVPMTKHVPIRSVSILVQTLAVKMPNVESIIIAQFVIVWMVTLVIHSVDVIPNHVSWFFCWVIDSMKITFLYSYLLSTWTSSTTRSLSRPMQSVSLWSFLTMSRYQWITIMLMLTNLHWCSS